MNLPSIDSSISYDKHFTKQRIKKHCSFSIKHLHSIDGKPVIIEIAGEEIELETLLINCFSPQHGNATPRECACVFNAADKLRYRRYVTAKLFRGIASWENTVPPTWVWHFRVRFDSFYRRGEGLCRKTFQIVTTRRVSSLLTVDDIDLDTMTR